MTQIIEKLNKKTGHKNILPCLNPVQNPTHFEDKNREAIPTLLVKEYVIDRQWSKNKGKDFSQIHPLYE